MKIRLVWDDQRSKILDAYKDSDNNFLVPNKIVFGGEIFQLTQESDSEDVETKIYRVYKKQPKLND